jgi:hypothetical protein
MIFAEKASRAECDHTLVNYYRRILRPLSSIEERADETQRILAAHPD